MRKMNGNEESPTKEPDDIEEIEIEEKPKKEKKEKKVLSPEEKKARNKKIITRSIISLVIIGLSIGASFLGPSNMEPGLYQVQLSVNYGNQEYNLDFNITMASSANTNRIEYIETLGSSGNSCIFLSDTAFKSSTNSKIEFRVGLLNSSSQSIENIDLTFFRGKIVGENVDREIRPTKIETIRSSTLDEDVTVVYFTMAVPYKAGIAMAILVITAGLWISEIVPTIVPSFIVPIIVVTTKISSTSAALQPFFDPVIALFFGGFIIAEALKKHQIDRRFALGIVSSATFRPSILLLILMGLSAFMSMWMSNTASAAVMIPIAIGNLGHYSIRTSFRKNNAV